MNPAPPYAVLFRTHVWDQFTQVMARHVVDRIGGGDFFVLADETNGVLNTGEFPKIAHTTDFSGIGLALSFPHKERYLWYNGDFPLFAAALALPYYDYFCMIEYDAIFNHSFDALFKRMRAERIEAVGFRLRNAPQDIADRAKNYFNNTRSLLPCIFAASQRAVEYLFQTRRRISEIYKKNPEFGWPFCEVFLGAALTERLDIRYADLGSFGNVKRYEFWPPHLYSQELFSNSPSFVHPVLDPKRYAKSRLMHGGGDFFNPNSDIRRDLENLPPEIFIPALRKSFEDRQDFANLEKLERFIKERALGAS